jgi:hypothetical protein
LLTLRGVTLSNDGYYVEWSGGYDEQAITRVHATSFDFQFFGPDADVLNEVVSQQLIGGDLAANAFLELRSGYYFEWIDFLGDGSYAGWDLAWRSPNAAGVSFRAGAIWLRSPQFSTDENGFPVVEPLRTISERSLIGDFRLGNDGWLTSLNDVVEIGSTGPPNLPLRLSIEAGSALEGSGGTRSLFLPVKLSANSADVVTVEYETYDGDAVAKMDYVAARGVLTFSPGQTSREIAVSINSDRKPEANETFFARIFNAVGATIDDAVGAATIFDDDFKKKKSR